MIFIIGLVILLFIFYQNINYIIDKYLFCPPKNNSNDFIHLHSNECEIFNVLTKNNYKVTGIKIVPQKNPNPKIYIIYSYGAGGFSLKNLSMYIQKACELGIGIIRYDYIGYGLSESIQPSEAGCYESLDAIMKYLLNNEKINPKNMILIGTSMGTGVVVDYVAKNSWKNPIILISPYKSICKVIYDISLFEYPFDKFKTINKLVNVICPVKIIHGINDKLINISHSHFIYHRISNKIFKPDWIENAGHYDIPEDCKNKAIIEILEYLKSI